MLLLLSHPSLFFLLLHCYRVSSLSCTWAVSGSFVFHRWTWSLRSGVPSWFYTIYDLSSRRVFTVALVHDLSPSMNGFILTVSPLRSGNSSLAFLSYYSAYLCCCFFILTCSASLFMTLGCNRLSGVGSWVRVLRWSRRCTGLLPIPWEGVFLTIRSARYWSFWVFSVLHKMLFAGWAGGSSIWAEDVM